MAEAGRRADLARTPDLLLGSVSRRIANVAPKTSADAPDRLLPPALGLGELVEREDVEAADVAGVAGLRRQALDQVARSIAAAQQQACQHVPVLPQEPCRLADADPRRDP